MRVVIMMALIAGLTACAPHLSQEALKRQTPIPTRPRIEAVCDPRVTNPYLMKECWSLRRAAGENVGPLSPDVQQAMIESDRLADLQDIEEHRARAECSMRAQEANSNNFGLVHGFFAGLGTGSACINYYREIGVIR